MIATIGGVSEEDVDRAQNSCAMHIDDFEERNLAG
jgi:hypothetical protein